MDPAKVVNSMLADVESPTMTYHDICVHECKPSWSCESGQSGEVIRMCS